MSQFVLALALQKDLELLIQSPRVYDTAKMISPLLRPRLPSKLSIAHGNIYSIHIRRKIRVVNPLWRRVV